MPKPKDDEALKRLGGGRWQTRDERFMIEPQSGTWVVVDAEQTDDLGLALVRGPFGSLTAAKEAIFAARQSEPAVSPLAERVARLGDRATPAAKPATRAEPEPHAETDPAPRASGASVPRRRPEPRARAAPEPPPEPRWLGDLEPVDRRRARELMDALTTAGARDPEGIARRDVVGKVPAAASFAVARAIAALGPDASPAEVAGLLADGRDTDIGVRWRLVDGDGRSIDMDLTPRGS